MLMGKLWVSSSLALSQFNDFVEPIYDLRFAHAVNFDNPPDGISWVTWQVPARSISIGRIMICHPREAKESLAEDAFDTKAVRFHYAVPDASNKWKVVEDTQKNEYKKENDECTVMVNDMDSKDKAAAWTGGLWVAVEWKKENIFEFDYLVVM